MYFNSVDGYDGTRTNTNKFLGLNRLHIGYRGEFESMKNMGNDEYPCAAPRAPRELVGMQKNICCAVSPDSTNVTTITGLTGVADGAFLYNGTKKSDTAVLDPSWQWEIKRLSNLYIINGYNPADKSGLMYSYNVDNDKFEHIGAYMEDLILTAGKDERGNYLATLRAPYVDAEKYVYKNAAGKEFHCNENFFANWYPFNKSANIFEKYFKCNVYTENGGLKSAGDEITISGFPSEDENIGQLWNCSDNGLTVQRHLDFRYNNTVDTDLVTDMSNISRYSIVTAVVDGFDVDTYSVNHTEYYVHKMYVKLENKDGAALDFDKMTCAQGLVYCSGITLARRSYAFDHIAVHHNRIWGTSPSGNKVRVSTADNNFSFMDIDTQLTDMNGNSLNTYLDSTTPGTFTALCEYGDYVLAFKEDTISVIYGDNTGNYAISVIEGIGCIDGKSVAVTPGSVIFLAYKGFYSYNGSTPKLISKKLNCEYSSAVSGYDGTYYYTSAIRKDNDACELLTYDPSYGVWHLQDDTKVVDFFRFRDGFYFTTQYSIIRTDSGKEPFLWEFTTTKTFDNVFDLRGIQEIWIRAEIPKGGYYVVYQTINDKEFIKLETIKTEGNSYNRIPARMIMGNNFRLRICGSGNVLFYNIEYKIKYGGRDVKAEPTQEPEKVISSMQSKKILY